MKPYMLRGLVGLILVTASLAAQTSVTATPPAIPEEPRKHFIMGTTRFKDAKTREDYLQAQNEFERAASLAPQWPYPRYNLALAEDAAGNYGAALADLKVYQQFKLSEADACTAQDKIYEVEARRRLTTRRPKIARGTQNTSKRFDKLSLVIHR